MPLVEEGRANDFWQGAPALLRTVEDAGATLASSPTVTEVSEALRRVAEAIPRTPEPLGDMDPYLRDALLTGVIHTLTSLAAEDRRELRIAIERVRQALRDVLDERPVWRGGPKSASVWLKQHGLRPAEAAGPLGVSEGTARRWLNEDDDTSPSGTNGDQVMALAKIVNHLRHAMTARGALKWLERPYPALDDRTPAEELKDPASYRHLVHLAAGTRSFVAT